MKVIRIEYELNSNNWKANLLAENQNDALSFLQNYLKAEFRVIAIEEICELHGISEKMKNSLENFSQKRSSGRPKK